MRPSSRKSAEGYRWKDKSTKRIFVEIILENLSSLADKLKIIPVRWTTKINGFSPAEIYQKIRPERRNNSTTPTLFETYRSQYNKDLGLSARLRYNVYPLIASTNLLKFLAMH